MWCPSLGECHEYVKFSMQFPCDDALRGGGGYPGGGSCAAALDTLLRTRPRARPSTARPRSPPPPAFAYVPTTTSAVSVVIPSYARPHNLPHSVAWLKQLEPMHRPGSEILLSHGSEASYHRRAAVDSEAAALCDAAPASPGCSARCSLRHINATSLNARWYTAHRFHAARQASNEVIVHLDDDIVPYAPMLQALVDRVSLEAGFPLYAAPDAPPGLYGPSGLGRTCGAGGYKKGGPATVLTGFAATSATQNRRYVETFEAEFGPLVAWTRGNGEDLTFSFAVQRAGGARASVGTCTSGFREFCGTQRREWAWLDQGSEEGDALHARSGHYDVRGAVCACLAAGHVGEPLRECVAAAEAGSASRRNDAQREL